MGNLTDFNSEKYYNKICRVHLEASNSNSLNGPPLSGGFSHYILTTYATKLNWHTAYQELKTSSNNVYIRTGYWNDNKMTWGNWSKNTIQSAL